MHAYMSVFVHVCTGIYRYAYMYVKGHVGTFRCNVCAICMCVCVHVACTHTELHVCVYTYIYTRTLVYMCVYMLTYMHAEFRGVCVSIGMY